MALKAWISAFRLRTLPLALASIVLGSFTAYKANRFSWLVFGLTILTTVLLQVLSNLANDYGDAKKGTDNENRVGPTRAVQSGAISAAAMKRGMIICGILAFISGLALIAVAFQRVFFVGTLVFLLLGIGAIYAAIKYTVGKDAYGYHGMGDISVFLFFGLVGVIGTHYLQILGFHPSLLLPAAAVGMLSAGVLNLNNMRDIENDAAMGKNTQAVKLGSVKAKYYHAFLLLGALVLATAHSVWQFESVYQFLFLLTLPVVLFHLKAVFENKEPRLLDPLLKQLALTTLLFAFTFGAGLIL